MRCTVSASCFLGSEPPFCRFSGSTVPYFRGAELHGLVISILITLTRFNFLLGFVINSVIKFLLNVTYHEIYWIHYLYVPNRVPNFCTGLYLLLFLHFLSFDFTMTSTLPLQRLQRRFIRWGTWLPTLAASSTSSCSPPVARQYHLRGKRPKRFGKASSLFRLPLSSLSTGTTLRMT